jgi:predicted lipoprotein with Yx(FWY)xxD motif
MLNRGLLAVLTVFAGILAACGGTPSSSATPTAATTSSTTSSVATSSSATATSLSTGTTSLGTVLVSPQGLTLYYFMPEKGGVVACTGGCATTWPPLKVTGTPTKPSAVPGTLGTVALADGSTEVTYNGWPLHTYAADTAPGQTNGQGVAGKWFVATPTLAASANQPTQTPAATSAPYGY